MVLDVRPAPEYVGRRTSPARCTIPLERARPTGWPSCPPTGEVVAYCRGAYCVLAHDAVRLLTGQGRRAPSGPPTGFLEWRVAGRPALAGAA